MTYWKEAGLTYIKYAQITGRALRSVLKADVKAQAVKREEYYAKMANWTNGKQGESINLVKNAQ